MNFGIIAAGEGSRLVQEGVSLPKPLVNIDNRPMIGRLIEIFDSLGAETISVIVNEQMKEVASYLREKRASTRARLQLEVRTTPSSMHSFFHLARLLDDYGRFVLTTVDTIFRPEDFARYVKAWEKAPEDVDALMAVTSHIDDEKPLYVATDGDMRVSGFLDTPDSHTRFVSGGIYGLGKRSVGVLRQCMEDGVSRMRNYQRALITAGLNVRAFDMGKILDVDHADDIEKAQNFLGIKD